MSNDKLRKDVTNAIIDNMPTLNGIRAAVDAIMELIEDAMNNWQPIETAPKDGTAIWVSDGCGMEPVRTTLYSYGEWTNIYTLNAISWKPSHWMPLPTAPEQNPHLAAGFCICTLS